jgi:hypothetical protein
LSGLFSGAHPAVDQTRTMIAARPLAHLVLALTALSALNGCGALDRFRPPSKLDRHDVDFREALDFARRSDAAYLAPAQIEGRYRVRRGGHRVIVRDLPGSDVRFFVVIDDQARRQDIAVRGTSNLDNIRVDVAFTPRPDPRLGVHLHRGFALAGAELYRTIKPLLNTAYETTITGHSLGGALAVILGMYLEKDGLRVERIITFGQPKVTNVDGARKYAHLPLLRFVHQGDPVPDMPPLLSLRKAQWRYTHVGPEVILWTDNLYIFVEEHQALSAGVLSFWGNIGSHEVKEHKVEAYLASLRRKRRGAEEIQYAERNEFLN